MNAARRWCFVGLLALISACAGSKNLDAATFVPIARFDDPRSGPSIGFSLALSGDGATAVMNSLFISSDADSIDEGGEVYIDVRSGPKWASNPLPAATLKSPLSTGVIFGFGVAVSGDASVVAVLAPPIQGQTAGEIYVYLRPAAGWTGQPAPAATLTAPDTGSDINLNLSLSADGSTIAVGQPALQSERGSALVFVKPPGGWAGTLAPAAKLSPPSSFHGDLFGLSAASSGDGSVVAVGAPGNDGSSSGSTFVFVRPAAGWAGIAQAAATLTNPRPSPTDEFGLAVAVSLDGATICGVGDPSGTNGEALVFTRPPNGWSGTVASVATLSDFGVAISVAMSGDGTAIGVGTGVDNGSADAGSSTPEVSVFDRPAGGWHDTSIPDALLAVPENASNPVFPLTISADVSGSAWLVSEFASQTDESQVEVNPEVVEPAVVYLFEPAPASRSDVRSILAAGLARCRGR